MSTAAPWLNHQNSLAQRNGRPRSAARRRAVDVERLGLDQPVRLLPEADLAGVAEEPAVADDAVLVRAACRSACVAWAVQVTAGRTSRHGRDQPAAASAFSRGACSQQTGRQADGVDQDEGLHREHQ